MWTSLEQVLVTRSLKIKIKQKKRQRERNQELGRGKVRWPPLPDRDTTQECEGCRNRFATEEDPREANQVEHKDATGPAPREGTARPVACHAQDSFRRQAESMDGSPNYECPVCSVPKPPKKHGRQQVPHCAGFTFAVTAERNVQVVPQPCAQTDVPSSPEFL